MAAFLTLLAIGFYVVVYTMLLKRSTPQNIVIGGAAGALPPVIGWAAVTGDIALPALVLFAIVFYWTPPHFWALALRIRGDYAAADVPMLPVTHGVRETTRQIALYTVLMVAITLVFFAVAQMGLLFLAGALVLGGLFLAQAFAMAREGTDAPGGAPLQVLDHVPDRALRAHHPGRRLLRADRVRPVPASLIRRRARGAPAARGGPARSSAGHVSAALAAAALAVASIAACQPTLEQQVGIVYSVDSPALGQVDGFELLGRTADILTFDTTELRFRPEFPAAHLSEHQVLSDPIEVTYRTEGDRLVVTQLDDG